MISSEEIKKLQLAILDDVSSFCEKHHLRYSLAYGTLIGAVRHKGYIPWDDDIDIMMPRPDYIKFTKEYNSNYYIFNCIEKDANYKYLFGKVYDSRTKLIENNIEEAYGLYIDVFPVDGVFDENDLFIHQHQSALQTRNIIRYRHLRFKQMSLKFIFLGLLIKLLPVCFYRYLINKRTVKLNFEGSKVACVVISDENTCLPKEDYENLCKVLFEGKQYNCLRNYHDFLHKCYGDYMKLPPIEDQQPQHHLKVYWK